MGKRNIMTSLILSAFGNTIILFLIFNIYFPPSIAVLLSLITFAFATICVYILHKPIMLNLILRAKPIDGSKINTILEGLHEDIKKHIKENNILFFASTKTDYAIGSIGNVIVINEKELFELKCIDISILVTFEVLRIVNGNSQARLILYSTNVIHSVDYIFGKLISICAFIAAFFFLLVFYIYQGKFSKWINDSISFGKFIEKIGNNLAGVFAKIIIIFSISFINKDTKDILNSVKEFYNFSFVIDEPSLKGLFMDSIEDIALDTVTSILSISAGL